MRFLNAILPKHQRVAEAVTQVYLELSTHCNFSCKTCVRQAIDGFKTAHFSPALMAAVARSVKNLDALERFVLLGFGESLCHPDIKEMLTTLSRTGKKIVMVSNGHLLDQRIGELLVALPVHELYLSWDDPVATEAPAATAGCKIRPEADPEKTRTVLEMLRRLKKQAGSIYPRLGMEIVAVKSNQQDLGDMVGFWQAQGVERFVVTHLFPYREAVAYDILYDDRATTDLGRVLQDGRPKGRLRGRNMVCADQFPDPRRICPFIERGSLFVRVDGRVAPCPELAYTHNAYYWGRRRPHLARPWGDLNKDPLDRIWRQAEFEKLRRRFAGYFFPDCVNCYRPELCAHRMGEDGDCFGNGVPCGECLWSRGVIRCP